MTPIARCDAEIARAERELRDGHPDIDGLGLALGDWTAEKALIEQAEYQAFLERKTHSSELHGFAPTWVPSSLFDFQRALIDWSVRRGRCGLFADTGLGKTLMQLTWAQNVIEHTNRPVLILTPLAVGQQTVGEGRKFGIDCERFAGGSPKAATIAVTNYEKLHHFNPNDFAAVVCDESSAIKAFNGERRAAVTAFLRHVPYRLLCTATAAPNDYTELGTSSEAIGELGLTDMLSRFFTDKEQSGLVQKGKHGREQKFRFKGHAEQPFWRWVCSWARACRKPSDLGFDDSRFVLPSLTETEHIVETRELAPGMLIPLAAKDMFEERAERRRTVQERCEKAAELVNETGQPAVVWCHLNDEGDLLEKLIPDAVQVSGGMSEDAKEQALISFSSGATRVLVIKPVIGAWGLNWQHCAHVVTFASHSYEQYYQAIRRCWRFGQKRPVQVDLIASEGEQGVRDNLRRKAEAADRMFTELVSNMNNELRVERRGRRTGAVEVPSWL